MGVSLDANGWTVVTETSPFGEGSGFIGTGTRKIYVDSSMPDDSGDGSLSKPKKTLAGGVSLLRNGSPDWLLLKKGGVWTENFENGLGNNFDFYGKSPSEPMLVSSYGTGARPLVRTAKEYNCFFGIGAGNGGNRVAVIGIEGYSYQRDPDNNPTDYVGDANAVPASGNNSFFMMESAFDFLLIEDCKMSFYKDNISITPPPTASNFQFRRNICVDAWCPDTAHSQGIFVKATDTVLLEENFFDHNGWHRTVATGEATVFNRNIYLQSSTLTTSVGCTNVTARGNVSANSAAEGAQFRSGGTIDNNLFLRNAIGFDVGHNEGQIATTAATVANNVVTESEDRVYGSRGGGINYIACTGASVQGTNNIIAHGASTTSNAYGIATDAYSAPGSNNDTGSGTDGVHGITLTTILYDWHLGTDDLGGSNDAHGGAANTFTIALDLAGANIAGYTAPTRTVASYAGTIGLSASNAGFINAWRANSKDTWNANLLASNVNAYFRVGFNLSAPSAERRGGKGLRYGFC